MLTACKGDRQTESVRKIVTEWTGKEIRFPEGIPCVAADKDSDCISPSRPTTYKILAYFDSIGCTSCKLRLMDWQKMLAEADSLFPGKVDFLFFFQPKNERELAYLFKRDGFRYPVFFDRENQLERLNRFPSKMEYQCFLLNSENKVILIGNPALNPKVWELFKRQIGGEPPPEQETVQTTVLVETPGQDLGAMRTGETYACTFVLRNTGDRSLVIMDIKTSCGCTVPTWSRQPVAPGATTEVKVEVKPETPGSFRKTITVYGNMENAPLQLAVVGEVADH
jgi:hypothetical protein